VWLDTDRPSRTGDPEVVFAAGKTPADTAAALRGLSQAHPDRAVMATRVDQPTAEILLAEFGSDLDLDPLARTAVLGSPIHRGGSILVISAGTSDDPIAAEAEVTARVHGCDVVRRSDMGVAGLHRVLSIRDDLDQADAVIVCAGMDGALPSVVGGLISSPVIAVPTSVGYGAAFEGLAALLSMLNSCAPGVTVVNIDNGFGAGVAAARIARVAGGGAHAAPTGVTQISAAGHSDDSS